MTSKSLITVGRRKTAIARTILTQGEGKFIINNKAALVYLKSDEMLQVVQQPLKVTNTIGTYDIKINVSGGGAQGQIGAIVLGIARSLVAINEDYRKVLRDNGMLTRDPRMVERKKYGRPKARKRFQFSKR